MKSSKFAQSVLSLDGLSAAMTDRGWGGLGELRPDPLVICQRPQRSGLTEGCLFSEDGRGFRSSLSVSSDEVTRQFAHLDLFMDWPPSHEARTVISVELQWLRWNHDDAPDFDVDGRYAFDDAGLVSFTRDLDTVGEDFLSGCRNLADLAKLLMNLDDYPARCLWGGRPVSNDPYVYAALLAQQAGEYALARQALERGMQAYALTESSPR